MSWRLGLGLTVLLFTFVGACGDAESARSSPDPTPSATDDHLDAPREGTSSRDDTPNEETTREPPPPDLPVIDLGTLGEEPSPEPAPTPTSTEATLEGVYLTRSVTGPSTGGWHTCDPGTVGELARATFAAIAADDGAALDATLGPQVYVDIASGDYQATRVLDESGQPSEWLAAVRQALGEPDELRVVEVAYVADDPPRVLVLGDGGPIYGQLEIDCPQNAVRGLQILVDTEIDVGWCEPPPREDLTSVCFV